MKAEQVLTAEFEFNDEPLLIDEIDGLKEVVKEVRETKEKTLHRCEDRVVDYDVYWNSKTESVRIAAIVPRVSYEVTDETSLSEWSE